MVDRVGSGSSSRAVRLTVKDILAASRRVLPGARTIDVGLRLVKGSQEDASYDSRQWDQDADDLIDLVPLAQAMRGAYGAPAPDVGMVLDLYVYDGTAELLGNLDLRILAVDKAEVLDPFYPETLETIGGAA